ncbi:MAG: hypothetical protein GX580_17400 [Candidatus Hydrogenedens sp.]|nr:hypothetical protein [Candidatus Hydrogenedentota bacterium]NLF59405.1 hypothetical protein [Candidatus Hydrogenedens sp.]
MDKNNLKKAIRDAVAALERPLLSDIEKTINGELEQLCDEGHISLGEDYCLTGNALEWRIRLLVDEAGFVINRGRDGKEDFVIHPPEKCIPPKPIVLEVKSARKDQLGQDELRQLDDWVFDLSGEENARKHGLGGGGDTIAWLSQGIMTKRHYHPSPHKGVIVFNGPVGVPFAQRTGSCLSELGLEFAKKRSFCVIPFPVLIEHITCIRKNKDEMINFWRSMHETEGLLKIPE